MIKAAAPCDPRIERTRRVVLDTTIELLVEGGFGAVTIEAVAARSGVAKSTIYRHWPGRLELVHAAFHELKPEVPLPVDGDVRDRIVALLEHVARVLTDSKWSALLPTLIETAERDPEARELHARMAEGGHRVLVDLLDDGKRSGELPADLDSDVIAEALAGPIFLRRLMSSTAFDPADVAHLVDQILGARRPVGETVS
ncbi:MAG: TetR/AcrR family transcriptional regulator [Acidimicrobiales bacterium]